MNLVYLAAVIAVCAAAKLERTYLPPASAKTAGGSADDVQVPLVRNSFNSQSNIPKGAYDNEFEGVVVDAIAPGTRASGPVETGLGGPRISYGSEHSKVGGAAFRTNQNGPRVPVGQNIRNDQVESQTLVNFQQGLHTDRVIVRPQAALDRVANILRYENNRGHQNYNYAYETENGITAEENAVLIDGVQAVGGYSYTGDDGKLYKVTYTAGEGGYQPSGDHLPTPPPIPDEILRSLEHNAREAAVGLVDDGSYNAAKYNTGDDYTRGDEAVSDNNNRQPVSASKPESDADISGSFTYQNSQAFENFNVHGEIPPPTYNTPKDTTVGSNIVKYFPNNNMFRPTPVSEKVMQNTFTNENSDLISDKKESSNQGKESSTSDDFSRPIILEPVSSNQETNNGFVNRPYSTYTDSDIKPTVSLNAANSIAGLQSRPGSFSSNQINKLNNNVLTTQSSGQLVNDYPSNVDLNRESNVHSEAQNNFNSFNNIHSTILPSAELTTPFEDIPDTNRQDYSPQIVPQTPTQTSISTNPTFDSQSYNGGQSILESSQNSEHFQLNKDTSQQGYQHFVGTDKSKIIGTSQISDNAYYYNQPSNSFNTIKATVPTFVTGNINFANDYKNSISTKYPRPPTVAPVTTNYFTDNIQNQYSDVPQFPPYGSHVRPFTKYPQPPVISHIVPLPTAPTLLIDDKFPQYTGITQASVSPFPSTSMIFVGSNSNLQQPETSFPNNLHQQTSFGQSYNKGNTGSQQRPELNNVGPESTPSQQYDGEIYEYKKPEESLSSPTKKDESDVTQSTNDFSQFGQKLQQSMLNQPLPINEQNESSSQKDESQSSQNTPSLFDSQNLQSNINLFKEETYVKDKEMIMGQFGNAQTFGQEPTTPKFPSSFSQGSQPTEDYKNPFEFSSRIKPCCQGTRTLAAVKDVHNDSRKPLQQAGQDHREINSLEFGFHGQQNPQATSQLHIGSGEKFNGPRRPPNFDEVSGYHY